MRRGLPEFAVTAGGCWLNQLSMVVERTVGASRKRLREHVGRGGSLSKHRLASCPKVAFAKFNRYAYALNNPYKFIGPDGHDEEWSSNVYQMGNP